MHHASTIIMAGGQGSRLYPLTQIRSKPAVPIAGRFRLIDFPISNCIHSNLKNIFILTQFSSESLHRHIFQTYRFDSFSRNFVTILSAQQTLENRDWYQGTADAVRKNLGFLRKDEDLVLILSGDHLYHMDYQKFLDFHLTKKADISISVYPVSQKMASQFGVMKVSSSGRITDFKEKPKTAPELKRMQVPENTFSRFAMEAAGRTHLASMGIYVFNRDVLIELLKDTEFEDFGREVIPYAIRQKKVYGYFFDDYWEDIGTIRSFFDAHLDLTYPQPKFRLYDEARPIYTRARFLPGAKILDSEVTRSIICEGSVIKKAQIRNSIIGIRSRIGENTRLEKTILMGANLFESQSARADNKKKRIPDIGVGDNCEIHNAIVDQNARIGHNVKLLNTKNLKKHQCETCHIIDGIVVVPKNAVIPNGTVI